MLNLAQDLAAFIEPKDFAQSVTVNGVAVDAIFDDAGSVGNVGVIGMASSQPMLTMKTADVPASPVGKTVVVGSASYVVATHDADGTGVSRMMLESAT